MIRQRRTLRVQAPSIAEAMRRIQAELGPDARLQRLREIPARGFGRFWRRPTIEIEADGFDAPPAVGSGRVDGWDRGFPGGTGPSGVDGGASRTVSVVLEDLGMDPVVVQRMLLEALGPEPDNSVPVREHLRRVVGLMDRSWRRPLDLATDPATGRRLPVLLVGAPGVGKTTVLAKWMGREVASRGNCGPLWMLEDGGRPNFSEPLSAHAQLLGVPVETRWDPGAVHADGGWIDLPGVVPGDEADRDRLRRRLEAFGATRRWWVVNAAYDLHQIRRQMRFFAPLGCRGVIVTHLDEEVRPARVWNLALGEGPAVGYGSWGPRFSDRWEPLSPSDMAAALVAGHESSSDLRP